MRVEVLEELAMILPMPVPPAADDEAPPATMAIIQQTPNRVLDRTVPCLLSGVSRRQGPGWWARM
ncbi:MAG: hypothetical protein AAGF12_15135 [Myxococcota bacterium]